MNLTCDQERAVELFRKGRNVSVEAIPGAGKTAMLVRACLQAPRPCLIVAYNTQLSVAISHTMNELHLGDDVICCTFHALCTRTIAPARDDVSIERALLAVERGTITPRDIPPVQCVLIDEAQDVRELYVKLLSTLSLCAPHIPTMVVGDRMQLIYDWDEEFPATTATLLRPMDAFGGTQEWSHITLTESHRLTTPMAALVRSVFGTAIHSYRDGCPVEVRAGDTFGLFRLLEDVLTQDTVPNTMILVDRKRSNRPLCLLVNELSKRGLSIHIHGIDSDDSSSIQGKLRCSTWWAAKGMQTHTVVCIVPRFTPRNPLYVGLTRAFHRLIVVMDKREPHVALSRAIHALPTDMVCMNDTTRRAIASAVQTEQQEDSFEPVAFPSREMRALDNCSAPHSALSLVRLTVVERVETYEGDTSYMVYVNDSLEDASKATLQLALVASEFAATGRVRTMEDILHPTRVDPDRYSAAVRLGLEARYVSAKRPVGDRVIADDLYDIAVRSYERMRTRATPCHEDMANVALAALVWDSYDHQMRQLIPVTHWCHGSEVGRAVETAMRHLPSAQARGVDYDVRCRKTYNDGTLLTARAHATDASTNYMVVWGENVDAPSHEMMTRAAVRAAMHPTGRCHVVDLVHEWVAKVEVEDAEQFFMAVRD